MTTTIFIAWDDEVDRPVRCNHPDWHADFESAWDCVQDAVARRNENFSRSVVACTVEEAGRLLRERGV